MVKKSVIFALASNEIENAKKPTGTQSRLSATQKRIENGKKIHNISLIRANAIGNHHPKIYKI